MLKFAYKNRLLSSYVQIMKDVLGDGGFTYLLSSNYYKVPDGIELDAPLRPCSIDLDQIKAIFGESFKPELQQEACQVLRPAIYEHR